MSALFLIGAGASRYSGPCTPHPPPLGNQLFAELATRGGVAATVSDEMRTLFDGNFEDGMVAFRRERDQDTTQFLREMAGYLVEFDLAEGNLYHELIEVIRTSKRLSTVATTNYECLIEQAMSLAGCGMNYGEIGQNRGIPLRKIHGSVNFLPDTGATQFGPIQISGTFQTFVEAPVRIASSAAEVRHFLATQDSLAPAIAVYAPGKDVLFSTKFAAEQLRMFQVEASAASVIYVIGLRIVEGDDHIWGALATSPARIEYVGGEPEDFRAWSRTSGRKGDHVLESTFAAAVPLIRIQMRT